MKTVTLPYIEAVEIRQLLESELRHFERLVEIGRDRLQVMGNQWNATNRSTLERWSATSL
jgi:hypothetical protein